MKTKFYCCECNDYRATKIIEKEQTLNVKGRVITLTAPVRVCEKCGEEIWDKSLDTKTLQLFYNEYRKVENLLLPNEIKSIRLKYGLSQKSFSTLLGFGAKTITRYENGAIQDICHDNLIRLVDSVDSFVILWDKRKKYLSTRIRKNVECYLTELRNDKKIIITSNYHLISQYRSNIPNASNYLPKGNTRYAS